MANGEIHKQYQLEDFRRYRHGLMPFAEQRDLEKRLMEDPLLAEAFEGFEAMADQTADYPKSMERLERRLQSRLLRKEGKPAALWAYATAAASIVLLLGTAWLVYFNSPQSITKSPRESESAVEIATEKASRGQVAPLPEQSRRPEELSNGLSEAVPNPEKKQKKSKTFVAPGEVLSAKEKPAIAQESQVAVVPPPALEPIQPAPLAPLSDAPAAVRKPLESAENERTAVSAARAASAKKSKVSAGPQPVGGMKSYLEYLDKSTRSSQVDGEVEVLFTVEANGFTTNFRTQGAVALYERAVSIVRAGPLWRVVAQNGVAQPSEVRLVLRFRKD